MSEGRAACVELEVAEADAELAADRLWSLGATAVEERASGSGRLVLQAGVPAPLVDAVLAGLEDDWRPRVVEIADEAWADAWRAHAVPVRAGRHLVIVPTWVDPPSTSAGDVVVRLDPGRAFGSGTHPSTRLVLAALERLVAPGNRALDVGCGSGVLAVTAALLGASVVAVDVDMEAVRATAANADRNGVGDRVDARTGDVGGAGEGPFDVVAVNIGAAAIVAAADRLRAVLAPDGHLVVAGFLTSTADQVRAALAPLTLVDNETDGAWVALTLRARAQ